MLDSASGDDDELTCVEWREYRRVIRTWLTGKNLGVYLLSHG